MSALSEYLSELVESRNINLNQLSKMTGISRATLHHYVHGKRQILKRQHLDIIIDALQISPNQKEKLDEAYQIECIGEHLFYQRKHVKEFFSSLENIRGAGPDKKKIEADISIEDNPCQFSRTILTKEELINTAFQILLRAYITGQDIWIYMDPRSEILQETLLSPVFSGYSSSVIHVFRLFSGSSSKREESLNNFSIIDRLFKYSTQITNYIPLYFYETNQDAETMYPLTEFIVTDDCVLQLATGGDFAILLTEKDARSLYKKIFERMSDRSRRFGGKFTEIFEIVHSYEKAFSDSERMGENPIYTFSGDICINEFWTPDTVKQYVKMNTPEEKELMKEIIDYSRNYKKIIGKGRHVSILVKQYLEAFIRTGVLNRLPGEYMADAFSVEDRKNIVNQMVRRLREDDNSYVLVDRKEFPIRHGWEGFAQKDMVALQNTNEEGSYFFPVYERSFSYAIYDFLESLSGEKGSLKGEDAVKLITEWKNAYL